MQPGLAEQRPAQAQPVGAVVVARDGDHRNTAVATDFGHKSVKKAQRLNRGDLPVKKVTGKDHGVGALSLQQIQKKVFGKIPLILDQRPAVDDAAEMPSRRCV